MASSGKKTRPVSAAEVHHNEDLAAELEPGGHRKDHRCGGWECRGIDKHHCIENAADAVLHGSVVIDWE